MRGYRFFLSPWLGSACRFEPTCSAYSLQALRQHGAAAGSYLTLHRLRALPSLVCRVATTRCPNNAPRLVCRLPGCAGAPARDSRQDRPMTDMRRTLLWVVFSMSLFLLWDAWNKHNGQPSLFSPAPAEPVATGAAANPTGSVPATGAPIGAGSARTGRQSAGRRRPRPRAGGKTVVSARPTSCRPRFDAAAARWCGSSC